MFLKSIKKTFDVSIIAHRGNNINYPENTILAFEKAIEVKADYIELDVQLSADKEMIIIHDYTTGRVADKDLIVSDTDLSTLKKLDFGQGQKIPTLQEVFDLCKDKIGINIEIKQKGLAQAVNELIIKYNMQKEVIISSFIHSEIDDIKNINPALLCASLEPNGGNLWSYITAIFNRNSFVEKAKKVNADAIHPYFKYVNKKFCKKAHDNNFLVNPWTSDKPKDWAKLINSGADSIITNDPERLYQFLSSQ